MSMLKQVLIAVVRSVWFLRPIYETARTACPVNHKYFFFQKVLGFNRRVPWPVHFTSVVTGHEFISIGINTAPGASQGNYIFAKEDSPIAVGDFTTVASNVCLGAFNHDVYDLSQYVSKGGIHIGRYCWIGANAVVLSGVRLGDHTVVAAGAVVTCSCEEGYAVLAGNPARVVKRLDKERVVAFDHPWHYRGYSKLR